MSINKKLTEWQNAGLITSAHTQAISAYEAELPSAAKFIWRYGLLGLGILTIMIGLVAIVASNWTMIPASVKLSFHVVLDIVVAGVLIQMALRNEQHLWRFEAVLLLQSVMILTLMALLGQILHTQAPMEQTMLLWWSLITPAFLWLGRFKPSFVLWAGLSTYVFFANEIQHAFYYFFLLIGFVQLLTILPTFSFWAKNKPAWAYWGQRLGLIIILISTNVAMFIHPELNYFGRSGATSIFESFGWEFAIIANLLIVFLLTATRYRTVSLPDVWERSSIPVRFVVAHLVIALVLSALPQWAGWFMIYWFGIGIIGLKYDDRRIVSAAITIMAIRIIVYYFELTHSLMATGIGMIFTGLGVLYLVKTYPRWRAALLSAAKDQL